jgi:hypothetical protein
MNLKQCSGIQVAKILDIGAIVELPGGKTALIHISELSIEPVTTVSSVVSLNELVDVMIISVDPRGIRASTAALMREKLGLPAITRTGGGGRGRGRGRGGPGRGRGGRSGGRDFHAEMSETDSATDVAFSADETRSSGLFEKYGRSGESRGRGREGEGGTTQQSSRHPAGRGANQLQDEGAVTMEISSASDSDEADASKEHSLDIDPHPVRYGPGE